MPFDRAGADEESFSDVGVREARAGELCDLPLLRRQFGWVLHVGSLAHRFAGRRQLAPRPLGERLHSDRGQELVGGTQLLSSVDAAVLAAQPLAIQQLCTSQLAAKPRTVEAIDGLEVAVLSRR